VTVLAVPFLHVFLLVTEHIRVTVTRVVPELETFSLAQAVKLELQLVADNPALLNGSAQFLLFKESHT